MAKLIYHNLKKNGIIDGTQIFVQNYIKPIEVIIVGAVHISQYLVDLFKNLDLILLYKILMSSNPPFVYMSNTYFSNAIQRAHVY
mgnify:CR=1 FL=1